MVILGDRPFVTSFLASAGVLGCLMALIAYLIDPYDSLPVSLPLKRAPLAHNQRFSYPALARAPRFDAAIISTSMLRMLQPERLDRQLDARFVNLSMNSATAWEQQQILQLFLRHHKQPKYILIGIDSVWCHPSKSAPRLAGRIFPEWLYDTNPWNDYLHILDFKALENVARQAGYLLGFRQARYGQDGYATLNREGTAYDLHKARIKIYGQSEPIPPHPGLATPAVSRQQQQQWTFPNLVALERLIGKIPVETRTIILFVPYHHHFVGTPGSRNHIKYERCKDQVALLARRVGDVDVLDMMYRNRFTLNDTNYWDGGHYHDNAAVEVENVIAQYFKSRTIDKPIARAMVRVH
jgi:hypothetical protein